LNEIVRQSIATAVAELERLVQTPTVALGYGRDLSCVTDVSPDLAEVDPMSIRALAEAQARRLSTRRGSLPDDDDYGLDLRAYVNRATTPTELASLQIAIRGEALKDDRFSDAAPAVTYVAGVLDVELMLTPVDATLGEFSMTLAVTSADVVLRAVSQ
jgi:hypothetical protein